MRDTLYGDGTIAALATATGGPIAIIRVSGPDCREVISRTLSQAETIMPRHVEYGWWTDPTSGKKIDEVLWVYFEGPRSFTGEDVLEIQIHGSPWIAESILNQLEGLGVRMANAGEFSYRAVQNGKMTVSQAEGVAQLIAAEDEVQHERAISQRQGKDLEWFQEKHLVLQNILAEVEVQLDFSDQGLGDIPIQEFGKRLESPLRAMRELCRVAEQNIDESGVHVLLVGAPNAGKSSLFNAWLGRDSAIVSSYKGTTRDVIREKVVVQTPVGTRAFRLHDGAGIRGLSGEDQESSIEKSGIERMSTLARRIFKKEIPGFLVWVVDPSQDMQPQVQIWNELDVPVQLARDQVIGVFNKSDIWDSGARANRDAVAAEFSNLQWTDVSALKREGLQKCTDRWVYAASKTAAGLDAMAVPLLKRQDQKRAAQEACVSLERAAKASDFSLMANDVRGALRALTDVFGEVSTDDILKKIFSEFCIGK